MTNIVYVVERHNKPHEIEGGLRVEAMLSPKMVEAWEAVRPLPLTKIDSAVPYVSVQSLENALAEGGVEAVQALLTYAKASLPAMSAAELEARAKYQQAIPATLEPSDKIVVRHKGKLRIGEVTMGHEGKPVVLWASPMDNFHSPVMSTDWILVSEFLEAMTLNNAVYNGSNTYRLFD
jgi:hypothetical protein